MSDSILVRDLETWSRIGVPEAERAQPQRLLVSLTLEVKSTESAALSDDVAATVDYARVCEEVRHVAAERPRKLVETLAEDIAQTVLRHHPGVRKVEVEVAKSILPETRSVGVRIRRKRGKKASLSRPPK